MRSATGAKTGDSLDLFPHGKGKEHEEVNDEDRPVHWDVKHLREGAEKGNQCRLR